MVICVLNVEERHTVRAMSNFEKKIDTYENVGHLAKMRRSKNHFMLVNSHQHNNSEEEGNLSGQTSYERKIRKNYTRENVFNISATWEYITI